MEQRLKAIGQTCDVSCGEMLYRFVNPAYSKAADIVNGAGALHASGRWNTRGAARLSYTALTPETALAEAQAHVRYFALPPSKALPRTLVALKFKAGRVLDLRDGKVRRLLRLSEDTIRHLDWRAENQSGRESITQAWGKAFAGAGFEAVIVPSAADSSGANVLVFPENLLPGSQFKVDQEVMHP
ncbi:RES family NAD+ phosphorylase [Prosthecobacter sp.]|uniref:RES family NAD+ phosphorylase n=1 Tax=Prosthecobacter sp. TaxID=1965333 RepID=UPI003783FDEE